MLDILREHWLFFLIGQYPAGPLGGVAMTLVLAVSCLAASLPIGIVLAVAAVSTSRIARIPAVAAIMLFRGMPIMLLIFWAYFLLPAITGISIPPVATLLVALILYQSAYIAEVVRSGINGVGKGQKEAASALGFGYLGSMTYFILPQALKATLPSLTNQIVSTVKETSLGYVISVNEMTYSAGELNNTLLTRSFELYAILAISYFALCYSIASLARLIEWSLSPRSGAVRRPVPAHSVATHD